LPAWQWYFHAKASYDEQLRAVPRAAPVAARDALLAEPEKSAQGNDRKKTQR